MKRLILSIVVVSLILCPVLLFAAAPYYEGKTITIMVPSEPGGGNDAVSRIWASFLAKYIPGKPKFLIRNMPGGSGIVCHNVFHSKAKSDGLTLAEAYTAQLTMQLRKEHLVKYDLSKYRWLGNIARAKDILVIRKGQKGRLTDPKAEPLVVATKDGLETWNSMTVWGREFLGWNVRWLPGMVGGNDMRLALLRREIDMMASSNAFVVNTWKKEGTAEPLATTGIYKDGKFKRRPDFPDVPTFEEILGDKKPTGIAWQGYLAWLAANIVDKALAAPAGTPDNIYAILNDAFAKVTADPEYHKIITKTISEAYDMSLGKETTNIVKEVMAFPKEALDYGQQLRVKFDIVKK